MARALKRYNSLEAHEYYERYRKRGVKKGRGSSGNTLNESKNTRKRQSVAKLKTEMRERIQTIKKRIKKSKELAEDGLLAEETIKSFKDEIEDLRVEIKQKYARIKKESGRSQELGNVKLDNRYELY